MREQFPTSDDTAVGASLTTIFEATGLSGLPICDVEIENTGAAAFTDFAVLLKDHSEGEWYTLSSGTDWASTTKPWQLRVNTPDPRTLGAGLKTHVQLLVGPAYGIQVKAKRTSATTAKARVGFGSS